MFANGLLNYKLLCFKLACIISCNLMIFWISQEISLAYVTQHSYAFIFSEELLNLKTFISWSWCMLQNDLRTPLLCTLLGIFCQH